MPEPRPSQLVHSTEEIRERVLQETDDVFVVYRKEWIQKHSASTMEAAETAFNNFWFGRVEDEDARILEPNEWSKRFVVQLNLWNPRGTHKWRDLAERHVQELGGECEIVTRSSRAEVKLQDYGRKKLVKKDDATSTQA